MATAASASPSSPTACGSSDGLGRRRPILGAGGPGRPEARGREPRRPRDARVLERPRSLGSPRMRLARLRRTATAASSTSSPCCWPRGRSGSRNGDPPRLRDPRRVAFAGAGPPAWRTSRSLAGSARWTSLECRFDELETDIPENQLLAAGLAIAKRAARDPDVRRLAARAHAILHRGRRPGAGAPGSAGASTTTGATSTTGRRM